jgi:hypothetical protein
MLFFKKEENSVSPLDILKPNTRFIDDYYAAQRYEICKTCPRLVQLTKQCKECGCFMKLKTKLEDATCPIGKW